MDPLTMAALASAAVSIGAKAFGKKGDFERTGGPSDAEVERAVRAAENEYRTGRIRGAKEGARTAMQAGAGALSRRGGGRSGGVGSLIGNAGAYLGRDMGEINAGATGLGERLRTGLLSSRRYEYVPSGAEQVSAYTGQAAAMLGQGAVLKNAMAPKVPETALTLGKVTPVLPSMEEEASGLFPHDTNPFELADFRAMDKMESENFVGPPLSAAMSPEDRAAWAADEAGGFVGPRRRLGRRE